MTSYKLVAAVAALSLVANAADAQVRTRAQRTQDRQIAEIPHCDQPIGSLTIAEVDDAAFEAMNLAPPNALLRLVIQRSGCFTLVERSNAARDAIDRERQLASSGALQRGSNLGAGQTRAADFILIPEVASQNENAGGMGGQTTQSGNGRNGGARNAGGSALRLLGGAALLGANPAGALLGGGAFSLGGGAHSQTAEANTVITIVNVRTSETLAVSQGYAAKRDINWNLSGSTAFGGFVGGGYENTEFGRILGQAFIDSYSQSVAQLQAIGGGLTAAELAPEAVEPPPAPQQVASKAAPSDKRRSAPSRSAPAEMRVVQSATLRDEPGGAIVRVIRQGQTVFPTGEEDGDWVEVIDEDDETGWVQLDRLDVAS